MLLLPSSLLVVLVVVVLVFLLVLLMLMRLLLLVCSVLLLLPCILVADEACVASVSLFVLVSAASPHVPQHEKHPGLGPMFSQRLSGSSIVESPVPHRAAKAISKDQREV